MEQFADTTFVDSVAMNVLQSATEGQSILDFIGLAGGFQWPILCVFVLGLGALMNTLVRIFNDGRQSTHLRQLDLDTMKTQDFRNIANQQGESIYHSLLRKITQRARFTSDHGSLLKSVGIVMEVQDKSLQRTNKLVTYCSSAAGGLGLGGTLVGMYSSFAAAGTDPNSVYVGISLALVSTLLGVAASLLLETAETFVSRYATAQFAEGREWGEDVCARLSHLKQTASLIAGRKAKASEANKQHNESS